MSQATEPVWQRRWFEFVVAITGTALSIGLFTLLLLPTLTSVAAAEIVEDPRPLSIGTVAEIQPRQGWSVQPVSREGWLMKSPDRVLAVTLRPAELGEQLEGRVLTETLSNGAELSHVTVESDTSAMLWLPDVDEAIHVEAEVAEHADPETYRAELAELLLHVKPLD